MKTRVISISLLLFTLILNACSPFAVASSSGEQPTPVVETIPPAGYQPVTVDRVEVEVGVGSPIPVEIVASGTWPDLCAQIAEVQSEVNGFQIDVTVLASTTETCPPDHLGLPFQYAFPLNVVEMEPGTYTITVNGANTTLDLPVNP
jgi:hypothetical protein